MRGGHKYLLPHSLTRAVFVPGCQDSGRCPHYVIRVMVSWRHGVMVSWWVVHSVILTSRAANIMTQQHTQLSCLDTIMSFFGLRQKDS